MYKNALLLILGCALAGSAAWASAGFGSGASTAPGNKDVRARAVSVLNDAEPPLDDPSGTSLQAVVTAEKVKPRKGDVPVTAFADLRCDAGSLLGGGAIDEDFSCEDGSKCCAICDGDDVKPLQAAADLCVFEVTRSAVEAAFGPLSFPEIPTALGDDFLSADGALHSVFEGRLVLR